MKINGTDIAATYPGIRVLSVDNHFPTTKIDFIDIKGRNGKIKSTIGDTVYNSKTIKIELGIRKLSNLKKFFRDVADDFLGANVTLVPDESYEGWSFNAYLTSFTDYELSLTLGKAVLNFDCDPFAIKDVDTVSSNDVVTSQEITLVNSKRIVMPRVTCDAEFNIVYGDSSWTVSATETGTFLEGFKLYKGNTVLTATGTGNLTFTYREGKF